MPRYLVTYHGGGMPEGEAAREEAMKAFLSWAQATGSALVDPGAPLGASLAVSASGVSKEEGDKPAGGYSVLEAGDLAAAADLVRNHPFVRRGGTLRVSEAVAP